MEQLHETEPVSIVRNLVWNPAWIITPTVYHASFAILHGSSAKFPGSGGAVILTMYHAPLFTRYNYSMVPQPSSLAVEEQS